MKHLIAKLSSMKKDKSKINHSLCSMACCCDEEVEFYNKGIDACIQAIKEGDVGLDERKIYDVLIEKEMEWYPYRDRLLPQKQGELLAKALSKQAKELITFKTKGK